MSLILDGTNGLSDVDGSAATPAIRGTDTNTGIFFPAADTIAFAEGGTEAMRLDSSGNLGIGIASPTAKLHIQSATTGSVIVGKWSDGATDTGYLTTVTGGGAGVGAGGFLALGAGGGASFTERMRVDTSGNLLVGTTSSNIGTANFGILLNSNGSINNSRNVNGGAAVMQVFGNAGEFRVYGNGTYATISDARIKENTVDATPKLQDLMNVRIVNYNIIGDDQKQIGVVAQELAQVFPSLVDDGESEDDTKAVRYSVFVPILIKAIQEQQAIITDLRLRIKALEVA